MLVFIKFKPHHVNFMKIRSSFSHMADFPLSVGGAMTMTQYGLLDVFRLGCLSNIKSGVDWTMCNGVTNHLLFRGET